MQDILSPMGLEGHLRRQLIDEVGDRCACSRLVKGVGIIDFQCAHQLELKVKLS